MFRSTIIATILACQTSAQLLGLDVGKLLGSLAPAHENDPRFTSWSAPGANDVRSPCPGLNTLANHGFLPHSGRNINIVNLLQGMAQGMNIGADFAVAIGGAALLSSKTPLLAFNLDDLDQHNFPIEHDASLSRQDAYFGNNHDFYNPYWQNVLSFYKGYGGETAMLPAALAISNRTRTSNETNPDFTYSLREFVLRYGESALYLQSMGGSDLEGVANLTYVRSLFEEERLPYHLGWRPRKEPITLLSLGAAVVELFALNPDNLQEGVKITADSYKDVFELIVGGSEVLNNITHGISSALGL